MWPAPEQFFIARHVPGDHARDVVLLAGSLLGPRAEFASTRRSIEQLVDRGCECARVPGGDEGAGTTVVQRRTDITDVAGNDRTPGEHRLEQGHGESLRQRRAEETGGGRQPTRAAR